MSYFIGVGKLKKILFRSTHYIEYIGVQICIYTMLHLCANWNIDNFCLFIV